MLNLIGNYNTISIAEKHDNVTNVTLTAYS